MGRTKTIIKSIYLTVPPWIIDEETSHGALSETKMEYLSGYVRIMPDEEIRTGRGPARPGVSVSFTPVFLHPKSIVTEIYPTGPTKPSSTSDSKSIRPRNMELAYLRKPSIEQAPPQSGVGGQITKYYYLKLMFTSRSPIYVPFRGWWYLREFR